MTDLNWLAEIFRCPACGDERLVARTCSGCGLAFPVVGGAPLLVRDAQALSSQIEEACQAKPGWYEQTQFEESVSPWRHHVRRRRHYVSDELLRSLAEQSQPRVPRMLDLGCGDGQNLTWLSQLAGTLHGCDYNPVRVTRAFSRPERFRVFTAEIAALPVREGAYDAIFFNHVLEHIPDDLGALRECLRVLRPGGLLVLGAPNEGCWWWQLAYRRAPDSLANTDHVHFYTAETLSQRVRQAGFALRTIKGLGFGPPDWAWDMRLRGCKALDDLFEFFGQWLIPRQCSSLYVLAEKPNHEHTPNERAGS